MTLWTIIIYLAILAVLVILHELGHFLVAKKFKVKVDEFGIGFPPRICKLFRWKGTDFTLNWLPIGGFVNLAGENAPAPADKKSAVQTATEASAPPPPVIKQPDDFPDQELFYHKPAWQRFLVILAGPVVNLLIAAVIFMIAYGVWGIPRQVPGSVFIDYVEPGSPADEAGIPAGSKLVSVRDATSEAMLVTNIDMALEFFGRQHGQVVIMNIASPCKQGVCSENSATYSARLRADDEIPAGGGAIGLAFTDYQDFFYPWYQQIPLSVYYGCRQSLYMTWALLQGIWQAIWQLFTPGPKQVLLMGPVGIVSELDRQETFRSGLMNILSFVGLLSLNLGIVNLLPIPAVDGGRLVLILVEKFCGRERVARVEAALNNFGMSLLLLLMLMITVADIWRLIKGG